VTPPYRILPSRRLGHDNAMTLTSIIRYLTANTVSTAPVIGTPQKGRSPRLAPDACSRVELHDRITCSDTLTFAGQYQTLRFVTPRGETR